MNKYIVCPDCEGEGKVLVDAFRYEVLEEDFAHDPEFMEEYTKPGGGIYGKTCPTCSGRRVVTEEELEAYGEEREYRLQRQHEIEMGY